MYKHILIPTDGSELSKMAIQEGVALAKALDGRVTVVTVTMPFNFYTVVEPKLIIDTLDQYNKRMVRIAEAYLDEAKNIAAASSVPCDAVHVVHEQPYRAIIDTAQKQGCEAILMASHGRGEQWARIEPHLPTDVRGVERVDDRRVATAWHLSASPLLL